MFKNIIISTILIFILSACDIKKRERLFTTEATTQLNEEEKRKPENALSSMSVADGLQVQLFAAEPMITNPTNISIDHKGRVWVCEAFNYDVAPDQKDENGDRIIVLEDTDGNGKADKRTVFYQGNDINTSLGIMVIDNKVYVSRSPNILILTDTNGDLKADKKDTLFTNLGKPGDHGAHTLLPGPDGRFYMAVGNYAGNIQYKDGTPIVERGGLTVTQDGKNFMGGMIYRFDPDGKNFEVVGHNFRNNYSPCLDSYGNIFQSDNDDDGYQSCRINFVMPYGNYGYMNSVTRAAWTTYRMNQEKDIQDRHWHQNDPGVVPNLLITGAGSPAGIALYEGNLLPQAFHGDLIHAEPYYNEVRSYDLKKSGAGYTAETRDLLKSKDQWFRPVDVAIASDGSLFVADWYDPILGGGAAGDAEKGRIYRVAPDASKYKVPIISFDDAKSATDALRNPNPETRFLAGQAILSMGTAAERELLNLWNSDQSMIRARSLWFLSRLEKGDPYLIEALQDKDASIRTTAVRIVNQLKESPVPYLLLLANDLDPAVRREAAIGLRFSGTPEAAALWTKFAQQYDGTDRWYLEALGIGADLFPDLYFRTWYNENKKETDSQNYKDLVWRSRSEFALPLLANLVQKASDTLEMYRYFRAFDFHTSPSKNEHLASLIKTDHLYENKIKALALQQMDGENIKLTESINKALNESLLEVKGTFTFLSLIEKFSLNDKKHDLLEMAINNPGDDLGVAATKLLLKFKEHPIIRKNLSGNASYSIALLENLKTQGSSEALELIREVVLDHSSPLEVKQVAVKALGHSWTGEEWLLNLVKEKELPEQLKPVASSVLFNVYRSELQREAANFLPQPASKETKLEPIKHLVNLTGNELNGKSVFVTLCSNCHQIDNAGKKLGPELTKIGSKLSKEGIFRAIIHPDEGISYGYEGFIIEKDNGDKIMGIISSETENEIEMTQVGGGIVKIEKSSLTKREKYDRSLMPALAPAMKQQELVDLVEYLSSLQ